MTTEQKIGQMFFVPCPVGEAEKLMAEYQFGGYILYTPRFRNEDGTWKTAEQVGNMLEGFRAASKVPPLFGVDEEGGTVTRASGNPNLFPEGKAESPQRIWKTRGKGALYDDSVNKNTALLKCGINVNLAPVADVVRDTEAFMYDRSMGADAETTADLVKTVVSGMKQSGIGCVLKHFPGYGSSRDTHYHAAVDSRPLAQLEQEDFRSFSAGIEAGADAVMMGHTVASGIDPDRPASLSSEAHRVLREALGFDGVILTDDLTMTALEDYDANGDVAVSAIQAGNDMLVSASFSREFDQIKHALETGRLREAQIDASVTRILKWKLRLGLIA